MACACQGGRSKQQYLWYNGEQDTPQVYNSEIEAKAKMIRKGGQYITYDQNLPISVQVQTAEAARVAAGG